jgi:hypothetical protein
MYSFKQYFSCVDNPPVPMLGQPVKEGVWTIRHRGGKVELLLDTDEPLPGGGK